MQKHETTDSGKKQPYLRRVIMIGGAAFAAVLIFALGIAVGNGQISFSSASSQNKSLPAQLDYRSVNQLYNAIRENYDGKLTEQQLLDGIKSGLAQATGDPYTEYFNKKDAQEFNQQLEGAFTGIGAELGQDEDKNLIVVAPIDGFPADKAGIRAKDAIVSIDGKSTSGMSIDDAVKRIRGENGTKVELELVRDRKETLKLTITRAEIKIPSVEWSVTDDNIGYMKITQFSDDTTTLATQAAQEFRDKNVKGVVLDMRDNPGGLLNAAVDVSSLWLPKGTTVLQEKRDGKVVRTYSATGNDILKSIKTTVLINGGSASASEITAGALLDNKAATLIGEKSFGKGSVQQIQPLPDGAEVKITIARWYRPNGQNIDKKGIEPTKKIELTDDDYAQDRDPQKDAAVQTIVGE
jgi:carboxyl-terminal processing protease